MKNTRTQWNMIDWRKCEHDLAIQQNKLVIAAKRGDLDKNF